MIVALCVAFALVAGWPIVKPHAWPAIAWGYRLRYEYQATRGRRRAWRLLVRKVEPHVSERLVRRLDRQLRLAGRPWPLTGVELLILQVLAGVGLAVLGLALIPQDAQTVYWLLAVLLVFFPQRRLSVLRKKRQLAARGAVRFAKRRLLEKLRLGLPLDDALRSVAEIAPGEFGETFRRLLGQTKNRSLKAIAVDLRKEYEVQEVDTFSTSLEYSDEKSPASLIESLRLQIAEEDDQLQEFIEAQLEGTVPKLYGVIAIAVLYTLVLSGYFFWAAARSQMGGVFTFQLF
ncbi:MAG: type II secretion system F family protein [Limnochordales bacterium]|nr:type II secretion system F family protein [Limnochordales bacterium]